MERTPLATVTLVFGLLSVPLAFLRHLCSLALVLAVLALLFRAYVQWRIRQGRSYGAASLRRSVLGGKAALVGGAAAVIMWLLWATGALLG